MFSFIDHSPSAQALILLGGALFAFMVKLWDYFGVAGREPRFWTIISPIIVACLVSLLTFASIWQIHLTDSFVHSDKARWSGPWDNPNTFGVLMGTAVVLTFGFAIQSLGTILRDQRIRSWKSSASHYALFVLCVFAASLTCCGLIHSYSRGAWVAALCGLAYFLFHLNRLPYFQNHRVVCVIYGNKLSLVVIICAIAMICFCHFQHSQYWTAKRAFSIANINDFSWRNRVAAWEGALQIIAEHPGFGVGWDQANLLYEHFYLPPNLTEGVAIQLNDYLMLCATLGIPALLCLIAYFWMSLSQSFATEGQGLKLACRAGAIVLLVGFWFDGGLFKLPTAATFWILLELGATGLFTVRGASVIATDKPGCKRSMRQIVFFPCLVVLLFLGALFHAKEKDPYSIRWFTLRTANNSRLRCIAVLPKRVRYPLIVYAHGFGDSLVDDGNDLRQMAELGLATISFEYNQTNEVAFVPEFQALLRYVGCQSWANTNAVVWVGSSMGANRMWDFAVQHPKQQPQLLVQLSGAGMPDGDTISRLKSLRCPVLLIHGDRDAIFPVEDTERLTSALRSDGVPTDLKVILNAPHSMEPDRETVFRCIGEYSLTHSSSTNAWQNYHSIGEWVQEAPPLWLFCIPAVAWALGCFAWLQYRRPKPPEKLKLKRHEIGLRLVAATLAVWALYDIGLHLIPSHCAVTDKTLGFARKYLVPPKERADYEYLAALPIWHNVKLKTLLTDAELANYNRELINWQLEETNYQNYVLSPVITDERNERFDWRRPLWEEFYPRIRHENSPADAAAIVVRHLRESVTIAVFPNPAREVPDIWLRQITDKTGFQIIYVAALRSIGVPARLDSERRAKFFDGTQWRIAPAPTVVSWLKMPGVKKSARKCTLTNVK